MIRFRSVNVYCMWYVCRSVPHALGVRAGGDLVPGRRGAGRARVPAGHETRPPTAGQRLPRRFALQR